MIGSRTGAAAWELIPTLNQYGWPNDPCPYATVNAQGELGNGYHVPNVDDHITNQKKGYWNGIQNPLTHGQLTLKNNKTIQGRHDSNWTIFLPYAKMRNDGGAVTNTHYYGSKWYSVGYWTYLRISTSANSGWQVLDTQSKVATPVRCVR